MKLRQPASVVRYRWLSYVFRLILLQREKGANVQYDQPLKEPGLIAPFLCNCADCRKVCNSMFATNFTVDEAHVRYIRGSDNLTTWGEDVTPSTGKKMTN